LINGPGPPVEADAVVGHGQGDRVGGDQAHVDRAGGRVLGHVADRLLGDPEDELGDLVPDLDGVGQGELDLDAPAGQGVEQVAEGGRKPGPVQAGRVDLDQQGPQGADAAAQGLGAALHGLGLLAVPSGPGLGGRPDQGEGGGGEVLDDPVVEVAGDPAALGVGGLDGPAQQPLPLAQGRVQPPGGGPGQGELEQGQQQQGPDDDGDELAPHGPGVGRDRAVARVGLEQQGLAARGRDRQVHLEEAALVALEAVLGGVEVAQLGGHGVVAQHLLLVHGQGVAAPMSRCSSE
jgi:hypothetical protein